MGVNVVYAPVVDLATNPANPALGIRAFRDEPAAVARHGAAMVRGLQAAGVALALVAPDSGALPAGHIVPRGPVAAEGVGEAVTAVLADPSYRERARAVVDEVAALPSTDDVVATLPALVGRPGS